MWWSIDLADSASTLPSCSDATSAPSEVSSVVIVRMSSRRGAFVSVSGWSVSSAAGISARQAFLAPAISISPLSGRPPATLILSIPVPPPAPGRLSVSVARDNSVPSVPAAKGRLRPIRRWGRPVRLAGGFSAGAGLSFAPAQVVAQRLGQPCGPVIPVIVRSFALAAP